MNENVKIRIANKRDIKDLINLHTELYKFLSKNNKLYQKGHKTESHFFRFLKKNINNKKVRVLVAEYRKRVIGFYVGEIEESSYIYIAKEIGMLHDGFVLPEFRRLRVGQKLLQRLMSWFREHNIKYVAVVVDSNNKVGYGAWKKYGFHESQKVMIQKLKD